MIIATLVRSSKGSTNRSNLREELESPEVSAIDPVEIDELRIANDELTKDIYCRVAQRIYRSSNASTMTYGKFLYLVKDEMAKVGKGEEFTIQLGHILDRVVFSALKFSDITNALHVGVEGTKDNNSNDSVELPVPFFLTVYSLAMNASADDRIDALFDIMKHYGEKYEERRNDDLINEENVKKLVSYLQASCQLPPETQVVEKPDAKYPIQQYERASAENLLERAKENLWKDKEHSNTFSLEEVRDILCSPAVCAWGECFSKIRKKQL